MKMKYNFISKFEKFLSNKTLLNIVVGISFLNIIGFVMFNKTIAIVYFILIGLLTSMFSKNMVIVLLTPLLLVNLFVIGSNKYYSREGLENKDDTTTATTTTSKTAPAQKNVKKTSTSTTSSSTSSSSTNQGLPITPLDNVEDNVQSASTEGNVDESFEVGRGKKNSQGYNIDYASTVEDAYDELNKILGSDGIKRLTNDTQNLMKQQLQLAESMKSMQPLIAGMAPIMQQAQGLLQGMGDNGNLGNLADIAKKFTAGLENKAN
jgi:hypothetical protein